MLWVMVGLVIVLVSVDHFAAATLAQHGQGASAAVDVIPQQGGVDPAADFSDPTEGRAGSGRASRFATGWWALFLKIGLLALVLGAIVEPAARWIGRQERLAADQRQELERLAEVAKRTHNAVIIADSNRHVTWVNEAFTRMSGYSLEEMIGRVPGHVFQSKKAEPAIVVSMAESLTKCQGWQGESVNRTKDGIDYWVSIDLQPRYDSQGDHIGFIAIESDITDLKLAQLEQERAASQLAGFFDSSLELLCIADPRGHFVKVNNAWSDLLGIPAASLCGRAFLEFVHPDDQQATRERLQELCRGEAVMGFQNRYRASSGTWRTLEWRSVYRDGSIYATARDITEKLDMERALIEQAERTELALAGGELATWDWEIRTGILRVDERWAAMIGESVDTLGETADAWSSRVHPDDLPRCLDRIEQHIHQGVPYQDVRFRMRHRDGTWRWMRASGKVVSWDEHGKALRMVGTHSDATERMFAEVRLNEANQRMELAIQAGEMALWEWDLDTGRFTFDRRWAHMLGEDPQDLLPDASTLLTRVHPDDLDKLEHAIEAYTNGDGSHIVAQFRVRCKEDGWRWVRIFGKSTAGPSGRYGSSLVGIQMDVHQQVVAQEELARREALLANTARMARIGGWELELKTMDVYWSDQVREIHEVPPGYLPRVEQGIEFYEPEDRPVISEAVRRAIEDGQSFDVECRFRTAKGNMRWVRSFGEPVWIDGKIARLTGAFQDITEQRAQREALENSNRALESAQSIARLGNWSLDIKSGRVQWSKQLYDMYEWPVEREPPDHDALLSHYTKESAQQLAKAVQLSLSDGVPYAMTLERSNVTNGVRYVAVDGRPQIDESGSVVGSFGTVRDVTAEVERESALREARARSDDANRSKTEFLANMSHEIRTPMSAILGYADLLEDPTLTERQRSEHVGTIKRNGEQLLAIINDILDISKIEAGRMLVERIGTSPHEVLKEVAGLMRVKAEAKGIDLRLECATPVPETIQTDPTRLRQILVNLVGNAIKFTELGHVAVVLGFEASGAGGTIRFAVEDTGIGMNSEQLRHCFTAFTQADASVTRRFGGTGLGLRISQRLADMLGGEITVRSEPGVGSTFTLSIDAGEIRDVRLLEHYMFEADSRAGRLAGAGDTPARPLDGIRILLMEDGPDNLRLISTHLRACGANVTTARNGLEGMAHLTTTGTPDGGLLDPLSLDAILSDMQMPEMDGYTTVSLLREKGCDLPIVALTAHAMPEDEQRCLDAGCDAYAAKPLSRDQLVAIVLRAMEGRKAA